MKIMILVGSYPPIINSAARLYSELAESLIEMGHTVTVITQHPGEVGKVDKGHAYYNTISSNKPLNGVKVLRVSALPFLSKVPGGNAFRYFLFCLLFGIRGIFTKKPDVILVYSSPLYMGISGYIVAKIKRTRFVFNMQDIHPKILIDFGFLKNRFIIKLLSEMEDFVYKKAYNFIVYSEGNKDYLIQKGVEPDNIFIIHNWVDTEFITPSDRMNEFRKVNNFNNKFIVLFAGSIRPSFPVETIIEASEMLKSQKDIVFLVVGDGSYKLFLQKSISEKNIDNVVLFPSQLKEKYVNLLNAADVYFLPLDNKFPVQVVPGKFPELMAAGRPIIASVNLNGDTAKIIKKAKCGLCIEPNDPNKLSQSVILLYKDKKLREEMGKNGRIYAEQEFSRDICVRKYEQVLFLTSFNEKYRGGKSQI